MNDTCNSPNPNRHSSTTTPTSTRLSPNRLSSTSTPTPTSIRLSPDRLSSTPTSTSTRFSPNHLSPTPTATSTRFSPNHLSPTPTATSTRFSPDRPSSPLLPHHKLLAYTVSLELLAAVRSAGLRDATLRDHALRSAKSACLNAAEGAGRSSRPDKARAFTIARAEACEAAAAVEIAASCGDAPAAASAQVNRVADRLVALLTGLIR